MKYVVDIVDGVWKVFLINEYGQKDTFINDACSFAVADAVSSIFNDIRGYN